MTARTRSTRRRCPECASGTPHARGRRGRNAHPLHKVIKLVAQSGGNGSVVVASPLERGFRLVMLNVTQHTQHTRHDDCDVPVGTEATLADILKILTPGASITVKVAHAELEIQEGGQPVADEVLLPT